ncbi:ScbA/BarX family gamma-butyrolactone biosynthesis protein [Streptomyces sp. SP18CS02]|uniref:ScbA/BarX family gamma-butyrolactone biosynthesis protein n=1 Tax=Streptomyces sp. SP18CS02 TaxID=3002531 RepID=UPI002E75FE45|nr:ScbA/BarX family gamma-butyrolactone biosynthesis protein [Streptomyces sp. SP18CS02]MEE1757458.1 ScbA/BarX family gamma-butyrolactone biosynthesis protein [Streptomyces sp. SP18CS02]
MRTAEPGVPKEYVHLRNEETIYVTGWTRLGPDDFSLTARWPAHSGEWRYDPRMLAQLIRQSGLVIAHAEYSVPTAHQTLLHDFNYSVEPAFRLPRGRAVDLDVEVGVSRTRHNGRAALSMDIRVLRDGVLMARADSQFGWISPAAYRRLRGEHLTVDWARWPLPAPLPPESVGRDAVTDVVLAAGDAGHRWQLRNESANVLLFDHPVDHVPGLVLIEAAYQAAHAGLAPVVFETTAVTSDFTRYVEFDEPCWIDAEVVASAANGTGTGAVGMAPGPLTVLVTGTQGGETAFRIALSGTAR